MIRSSPLLVLKGLLMGAADLVPGISGGTIALIVGVYERLIANLDALFTPPASVRAWREWWRSVEWTFLILLGVGIGGAIIAGSHVIPALIERFPIAVFSFFIGVILASVVWLYRQSAHDTSGSWVVAGVVIGATVALLPPLGSASSSPLVFFIGGMLAISAMLLPGISGSYILLLLGLYETVLSYVGHPLDHLASLTALLCGIGVGIIIASKTISRLLARHHDQTLRVLTGLMLGGCLRPALVVLGEVVSLASWLVAIAAVLGGVGVFVALHVLGSRS